MNLLIRFIQILMPSPLLLLLFVCKRRPITYKCVWCVFECDRCICWYTWMSVIVNTVAHLQRQTDVLHKCQKHVEDELIIVKNLLQNSDRYHLLASRIMVVDRMKVLLKLFWVALRVCMSTLWSCSCSLMFVSIVDARECLFSCVRRITLRLLTQKIEELKIELSPASDDRFQFNSLLNDVSLRRVCDIVSQIIKPILYLDALKVIHLGCYWSYFPIRYILNLLFLLTSILIILCTYIFR